MALETKPSRNTSEIPPTKWNLAPPARSPLERVDLDKHSSFDFDFIVFHFTLLIDTNITDQPGIIAVVNVDHHPARAHMNAQDQETPNTPTPNKSCQCPDMRDV